MKTKKPNILLMMADDHRGQSIGALGENLLSTPTMNRLIREGACFTRNAHTGSYHPAVCIPTRAALHTGTCVYEASRQKDFRDADFPDSHTINPERVTLGEALRGEGYHSYFIGKWHNDNASLNRSYCDGRYIFLGGMSDHYQVLLNDYDPTGEYPDEKRYVIPRHDTELYSEAAIEFLDGYKDESPFFLTVAFTSPHDPRQAPEDFSVPGGKDGIPLPPNFQQHPFDQGHRDIRDEQLAAFPREEDEVRRHIGDYYAMIQHQDTHMGLILEALERRGELENTIIIYTGDHGLAVGQHGLMGKQNLYEPSVRVPLILRGPGIPQGLRSEALTYTPDLFPTLCALTETVVPETVTARSLMPLIEGETRSLHEHQFCLYFNLQRSVSDGRFKLIRYYEQEPDWTGLSTGTDTVQLFDLHEDPSETRNLYGKQAYLPQARRLAEALREHMCRHDDMLKDVPILIDALAHTS
ncbi:MAG: sulfatase-like hydrolase/transferase [Verrucomicrobiota bacterium JB024]|nr:sulfatase-like hydrolase/transferase [Verrucomicrobiota bacterium JB024]